MYKNLNLNCQCANVAIKHLLQMWRQNQVVRTCTQLYRGNTGIRDHNLVANNTFDPAPGESPGPCYEDRQAPDPAADMQAIGGRVT